MAMPSEEFSRKLRVLIVEDEFMVGLHLESILERLGHDVVGVVADETEAMYILAHERPDLIMTDIHLQDGGDGLRVAREAQEMFGAKAIVITGHRDGETFLRAEETGACAFLRKPFGIAQVQSVFSRLEA